MQTSLSTRASSQTVMLRSVLCLVAVACASAFVPVVPLHATAPSCTRTTDVQMIVRRSLVHRPCSVLSAVLSTSPPPSSFSESCPFAINARLRRPISAAHAEALFTCSPDHPRNAALSLPRLLLCSQRHGNKLKKLNRPADQRKAMLRALTTELIRHGRIQSTLAKCKEVRKTADHMVTLAKDGSLHARRQALGYVYDKQLVHALFEQAPERYAERNGGYTRVLKDGYRRGDNSEMGVIEVSAAAISTSEGAAPPLAHPLRSSHRASYASCPQTARSCCKRAG